MIKYNKSGVVLEDLFENIEFIKKENSFYNKIKLSNLSVGEYELRLKKEGKTIKINIHRGNYWEQDSFILKKNCLFENKAT